MFEIASKIARDVPYKMFHTRCSCSIQDVFKIVRPVDTRKPGCPVNSSTLVRPVTSSNFALPVDIRTADSNKPLRPINSSKPVRPVNVHNLYPL